MFGIDISSCPITKPAIQPETSGNAGFLASLRDKLTGVANDASQPLPPGLLERIDNSRTTGEIDIALTNDISAYLTSVINKHSADVPRSDSPIEDNTDVKPTGTTPNVTILQKVMRETLRVVDHVKKLDDKKINEEAGRIADQLQAFNEGTLKREINRIGEQLSQLDESKLTREADRVKKNVEIFGKKTEEMGKKIDAGINRLFKKW